MPTRYGGFESPSRIHLRTPTFKQPSNKSNQINSVLDTSQQFFRQRERILFLADNRYGKICIFH